MNTLGKQLSFYSLCIIGKCGSEGGYYGGQRSGEMGRGAKRWDGEGEEVGDGGGGGGGQRGERWGEEGQRGERWGGGGREQRGERWGGGREQRGERYEGGKKVEGGGKEVRDMRGAKRWRGGGKEVGDELVVCCSCCAGCIMLLGWIQGKNILEMFTIGVR